MKHDSSQQIIETDYLVLGSGIAGLSFALRASAHGRVLLVTKRAPEDGNTAWAQGGISAVLSADDSIAAHIADTLTVGDGLCHERVVRIACEEAPGLVRELSDLHGARFDRTADGEYELGREGGHSQRRVAHAKDTTGREIERALLDAVRANPNIEVMRDHMAVDLLTMQKYAGANKSGGDTEDGCFGAYVLDQKSEPGVVKTIIARATVLATGGAGKVYLYTTNPDVATADGVAMAYRAGASVGNLEFFQFHPTCLYHPDAKSFLISEALRGEGGILKTRSGDTFMERYHPMKSLAPRDVVARAIDEELKRSGDDYVVLDMTHLDPDFVANRFPAIFERCKTFGIDIRNMPIPVVPAAHYSCGGVVTDEWGRTDLRNLYAVGEVSMTGLHGACRLASNSLLEGLVFGTRAAEDAKNAIAVRPPTVAPWYSGAATDPGEAVVVTQNWDEIRRLMWNYVGIVRTDKRLERARRRIELIREEIREYYWNFKVTSDLLELRNLALAGHLIIECARRRKESRGLHYTLDRPNKDESFRRDTILKRGDGPESRLTDSLDYALLPPVKPTSRSRPGAPGAYELVSARRFFHALAGRDPQLLETLLGDTATFENVDGPRRVHSRRHLAQTLSTRADDVTYELVEITASPGQAQARFLLFVAGVPGSILLEARLRFTGKHITDIVVTQPKLGMVN